MKRLFLFLVAALAMLNVMAENYRIDSVYHYFSFMEKPVASKTINRYDSKGKKIQSESYFRQDGKWSKGKITTYEYNSKGLLTKLTDISEKGSNTSYTQELYNYKDTLVTLKERRIRRDTAEWKTLGYVECEYNSQNRLIRESSMTDKFVERHRDTYLYDPAGNKIQHEVYEWINGEFIPDVRTEYIYDENNLLIQEKLYLMDVLKQQIMYEYDANKFLVQKTTYTVYQDILQPLDKDTYVNNKDGKVVKRVSYGNVDFKGIMVLRSKQENTYDVMGNLTSQTHMAYIQGTWYPLPNSDERWVYYFTELK